MEGDAAGGGVASTLEKDLEELEPPLENRDELLNRRRPDKDHADAMGKAVASLVAMTAVRQMEADAQELEAYTNSNKFMLEASKARISRTKILWELHKAEGSDPETIKHAKEEYVKALSAPVVFKTPTKSALGWAPGADDAEDRASSSSVVPGTAEVHVNVDA